MFNHSFQFSSVYLSMMEHKENDVEKFPANIWEKIKTGKQKGTESNELI